MNLRLIITGFILTLPLFTVAGGIEVCPTCPVSSVREAIELVAPGDTILIQEGRYKEGNIVITKPVTLLGSGYPVLDGDVKNEILTIQADSVYIIGLQFENIGVNYTRENAAINLVECSGCQVINNRMIDTFFAIYAQKSSNCIIDGNYIQGDAVQEMSSGNAIHAWYCKDMTITNNEVRNHRDGIYLEFVDNSLVENNQSIDNLRYGLHFMFSDENRYLGNNFESNGAGVAVMFSKHIVMHQNTFQNNWGTASYGLLLKEITDSDITENVFQQNTSAIFAESASRLKVENNDFVQNGWALKILGSCVDDMFIDNNFIGNTFDLTTNSRLNENTYKNNYWSEYSGYDLDKDGFGDVPHRPVSLFSHVVSTVPESIVLLRSVFVGMINFAERVTPVFSPESLVDSQPRISRLHR